MSFNVIPMTLIKCCVLSSLFHNRFMTSFIFEINPNLSQI